jgi:Methylamine utilisation protein MauE
MMGAASTAGVIALLAGQLAVFLATLLLISGLHKLARRDRSQSVVREFAGVPRALAPFAVLAAAGAELLAGTLLLMPTHRVVGGVLAASIWAAYLGLMVRAIAQGRRDVDCGCSFGISHRPLGAFQVARNAVLAGMGALVSAGAWVNAGALASGGATADGPAIASQILGALALTALYGALEQVMTLTPPRGGVLL